LKKGLTDARLLQLVDEGWLSGMLLPERFEAQTEITAVSADSHSRALAPIRDGHHKTKLK
jgi:hypothetical protein